MGQLQFDAGDLYSTCASLIEREDSHRLDFIIHELGTVYTIPMILGILDENLRDHRITDALRKAEALTGSHREYFERRAGKGMSRKDADKLHAALEEFYSLLPLRGVSGAGEQEEWLSELEVVAANTLRSYNLHFSPEARKGRYDLGDQVRDYWREYAALPTRIRMKEPKFDTVLTRQDYFTNAVFPLIKNVLVHAFPSAVHRPAFSVVGARQKNKGKAYVHVSDNGVGIDPAIRDRLFERGASTNPDTSEEHGIGLWSVKTFVEQHGGTISVESEPGNTRFTLVFDAE